MQHLGKTGIPTALNPLSYVTDALSYRQKRQFRRLARIASLRVVCLARETYGALQQATWHVDFTHLGRLSSHSTAIF